MRAGIKTIHTGSVIAGPGEWAKVGTDNHATMRFLRLMAATAQTEEARAIYLAFLDGERRLLPEHGGN